MVLSVVLFDTLYAYTHRGMQSLFHIRDRLPFISGVVAAPRGHMCALMRLTARDTSLTAPLVAPNGWSTQPIARGSAGLIDPRSGYMM